MKKTCQLFLKLGLSLGIFMMLGVTAFAASIYGVTETTATVGTNAALEIEYTVDTAVQTWANADTLTLTLPNNFPDWSALTFTAENDNDIDNTGDASETAITVGAGNGQYAISGKTITVKWDLTTWGAVGNGVETIRFLITAGNVPTYAGATSTFTFGGTTAAVDTNPIGTDTINVSAADANATLALASAAAGASTTATLTLTISSALANTDTITFTAPAFLDVSGVDAGTEVTGGIEAGGGAITCAVSGQVVTCTTSGVITAATGTLIFTAGEISGAYVDAGTTDITNLEVNRVSGAAGGADINSDSTVDVPAITVGDLTSTNVTPESLSLSTISPTTFTFVTTAAIPASAKIVITFPAGWNLAGAASQVASGLTGLSGTWTASVSGQILTLTGGTSTGVGTKTFTLNGIMTPPNEGGGGAYNITTKTSADANIEAAAVTEDVIIGKVSSSIVVGTPTGVAVTDNADGGVLITWTDPSGSTDATKDIRIMKGTAPMPVDGAQYALVLKGVQEYIDTNVEIGDVVTYQLRASNGAGDTGATTAAVTFTVGSTLTTEEEVAEEEIVEEEVVEEEEVIAEEVVLEDYVPEEGVEEEEEVAIETGSGEEVTVTDVSTHWARNYVTDLVEREIVSGYSDETFRPDNPITRAEFLKIVVEAYGVEMSDGTESFSDVSSGDWFYGYVVTAVDNDIVGGYANGTFRPNANITRAEAMKVLLETAGIDVSGDYEDVFTDVAANAWYADYINYAAENEIVSGYSDETFRPNSTITRGEVAKIVSLLLAE